MNVVVRRECRDVCPDVFEVWLEDAKDGGQYQILLGTGYSVAFALSDARAGLTLASKQLHTLEKQERA